MKKIIYTIMLIGFLSSSIIGVKTQEGFGISVDYIHPVYVGNEYPIIFRIVNNEYQNSGIIGQNFWILIWFNEKLRCLDLQEGDDALLRPKQPLKAELAFELTIIPLSTGTGVIRIDAGSDNIGEIGEIQNISFTIKEKPPQTSEIEVMSPISVFITGLIIITILFSRKRKRIDPNE